MEPNQPPLRNRTANIRLKTLSPSLTLSLDSKQNGASQFFPGLEPVRACAAEMACNKMQSQTNTHTPVEYFIVFSTHSNVHTNAGKNREGMLRTHARFSLDDMITAVSIYTGKTSANQLKITN